MTAHPRSSYEPHYRPLIVRKESKRRLRTLRNALGDSPAGEERRIMTAMIEMVMDLIVADPRNLAELERRIADVLALDVKTANMPDDIKAEFPTNDPSQP